MTRLILGGLPLLFRGRVKPIHPALPVRRDAQQSEVLDDQSTQDSDPARNGKDFDDAALADDDLALDAQDDADHNDADTPDDHDDVAAPTDVADSANMAPVNATADRSDAATDDHDDVADRND